MWISNVASPVVCLSVVRPLLRDLPADEPYVKMLLLAIAFANNIGGMTTPIASPQNILASGLLRDKGSAYEVSFIKWLGAGVVIAIICTAIAFGFLWLWFRPSTLEQSFRTIILHISNHTLFGNCRNQASWTCA